MGDKWRPTMSDAEREILKALWEHGPSTVREVQELIGGQGQEWTRSTVITLLQRLEKKGYVSSDKSQFAFVFSAAVTREHVMHQRMTELAEELSEGDAVPLVMAFAQQHRFTSAEIQRFRELIEEMATKQRSRKIR
jgi:predicted transcriptional regulator